jgi:hypothetical protein
MNQDEGEAAPHGLHEGAVMRFLAGLVPGGQCKNAADLSVDQ